MEKKNIIIKFRSISSILNLAITINDKVLFNYILSLITKHSIIIGKGGYINIILVLLRTKDLTLLEYINKFSEKYGHITNTDFEKIKLFLDDLNGVTYNNIQINHCGFIPSTKFKIRKYKIPNKDISNIINYLHSSAKKQNKQGFQDFIKWYNESGDINVVIDGGNVGYYNKGNYNNDIVNYKQIDIIYDLISKKYNNVLIVLHSRHSISNNRYSQKYISKWEKKKALYLSPKKSNDDYYWLSIAIRKNAYFVSNDKMDDHHFKMNSLQSFTNFKKNYQLSYYIDKKTGEVNIEHLKKYKQMINHTLIDNTLNIYVPVLKNNNIIWQLITTKFQ